MDVYTQLGLTPIINAWGTVTSLGGSLMHPRVLDAMAEASRSFVDVPELHRAAGAEIARMLDVDAVCITSGAAAGLTVAAAAYLTQGDPARVLQLPDTTGMRDEVLILKAHRFPYDQALQLSGARFREIGWTTSATIEQVEAAITERTAMFLYVAESEEVRGSLPFPVLAEVLARHGVPVVVDAAAELPPLRRVRSYLDDGAALVILSGGKELCGPQSSGLVFGDAEAVKWCAANSFPHNGVGRAMKTDKETIVGLLTAVELFVERDYDAIFLEWEGMLDHLFEGLTRIPEVRARRGHSIGPGVQPTGIPRLFVRHATHAAASLQRELRSRESIAVGVERDELVINPQCLRPGETAAIIAAFERIVATATACAARDGGERA